MKNRLQLYPSTNEYFLSQVELAEICAKSERYIGTEGGGMDQSISFLAEEGTVSSSESFGNFNTGNYLRRGRLAASSMCGLGSLFVHPAVAHCPTVL